MSRLDQIRAARNALIAFALWTTPALAQAPSPAAPLTLRLADVGRFATFVDMGGVQWTGRVANATLASAPPLTKRRLTAAFNAIK